MGKEYDGNYIYSCGASTLFWALASPDGGFTITLIGQTTLGRTPLDECSGRCRDLYMTHKTQKR